MLLLYNASLNLALPLLHTHYISGFSIGHSIQISALARLVDTLSKSSESFSCCRKSLEHWIQFLLEEAA